MHQEFYKYFVRALVGKQNYAARVYDQTVTKESQIATTSDEAMALLLLENSYDRWIDLWKLNGYDYPEVTKGERSNKKRNSKSKIVAKYTSGGIFYKKGENDELSHKSNLKGWSDDGIQRYNALYKEVLKDRKEHPGWFKEFLKAAKSEETTTRKKPIRKGGPVAIHNLFNDSDEESEEEGHPEEAEHNDDDSNSVVASESEGEGEED